MQSRYTQRQPAQQHTVHRMLNGTRSGSSTRNHSTTSGGNSARTDQNPSARSQRSSSRNGDQNSSASSCGTQCNENGRQQLQSGEDNEGNESSEGQQMSHRNDNVN